MADLTLFRGQHNWVTTFLYMVANEHIDGKCYNVKTCAWLQLQSPFSYKVLGRRHVLAMCPSHPSRYCGCEALGHWGPCGRSTRSGGCCLLCDGHVPGL